MIYHFIENQCSVHSIEKMCKLFNTSRSGYYTWKKHIKSKRVIENEKILKAAKQSYEENRRIYGLDKLLDDVRECFPHCSRKRLYNLQKQNNLYSIRKRKFKATTYSDHKLPVAKNLLNRNFNVDKPNEVWVTDISYIGTNEGWLYLATVKDLYTKEIVGFATDDNMKTQLCINALNNAINRFKPAPGLIHHSDRGIQHCSNDYQEFLKKNEIICSMSRKGNCWDNACAETFFSTIKCELLYQKNYITREEARRDIFWYIEIFYNRKRKHQAIGYMIPSKVKNEYKSLLT